MSSMSGSSASTISAVTSETPGVELGAVLGRGRELGAHHEQLALEPDQELVELRPRSVSARARPERRDRFVDRAVRIGAGRVLARRARRTTGRSCRRRPCACRSVASHEGRSPTTGSGAYSTGPAGALSGPWMRRYPWPRCRRSPIPSLRTTPDRAPTRRTRSLRRKAIIKTARPKQWTKNVLVFAAPAAAGVLDEREHLLQTLVAFVGLLPRGERHLLPQRRHRRRGRPPPPHQAAPTRRRRRPRRTHARGSSPSS